MQLICSFGFPSKSSGFMFTKGTGSEEGRQMLRQSGPDKVSSTSRPHGTAMPSHSYKDVNSMNYL